MAGGLVKAWLLGCAAILGGGARAPEPQGVAVAGPTTCGHADFDAICPSNFPMLTQSIPLIVIDAGHGGEDIGAIGVGGLREKDVNLRTALAFGHALELRGFRVVFTRDTDVFISLDDRAALARRLGADLFISLHADWSATETRQGVGAYVQHTGFADGASPPVEFAQSSGFSNIVLRNVVGAAPLIERPLRAADFAVLRGADRPAALLEVGFVTNPQDATRLSDPAEIDDLAQRLAHSVSEYFAWPEAASLPIQYNVGEAHPAPFSCDQAQRGALVWPVSESAVVTQAFGSREGSGRPSHGMRLELRSASEVCAAMSGAVAYAGDFRSYGQTIILQSDNGGPTFTYTGFAATLVRVGDRVEAGQALGVLAPAPGGASELYVEARRNGTPVAFASALQAPRTTPTTSTVNQPLTPPSGAVVTQYVVQAGAFSSAANAANYQRALNDVGPTRIVLRNTSAGQLNVVEIGPFATPEDAMVARSMARGSVAQDAFVREVREAQAPPPAQPQSVTTTDAPAVRQAPAPITYAYGTPAGGAP